MIEWDARQYAQFVAERVRPNEDLIARLDGEPRHIVDLGCGAGDCSTRALRARYPHAAIVGIDASAALIDDARRKAPAANVEWRTGQIETFDSDPAADLLFLGSSFQWVGDHPAQLARLARLLSADGTLAIQMPNMFHRPFYTSILQVAQAPDWRDDLQGALRQAPVLPASEYASILASLHMTAEIWSTTYALPFADVAGLVAWAKGAPLRPVSSRLDPSRFERFCDAYAEHLARHYQIGDGSCVLPFERIFIRARHAQP